jgi:hypothetical protein
MFRPVRWGSTLAAAVGFARRSGGSELRRPAQQAQAAGCSCALARSQEAPAARWATMSSCLHRKLKMTDEFTPATTESFGITAARSGQIRLHGRAGAFHRVDGRLRSDWNTPIS